MRGLAVATVLGLALVPGWPAGPAFAEPPRAQQWYLDQIGITQAHDHAQGDGVSIGLLADGIDQDHPDLLGQISANVHIGPDRQLTTTASEDDLLGTGTARAGLMVARGGTGLLGVAPRATVHVVTGARNSQQVNDGVRWLVDHGARVIDLSLGSTARTLDTDFDGIQYALAHDVVVVMDLQHATTMTAVKKDGLLLVGGIDPAGARPATASPDSRLALVAPGTLGLFAADGRPDRSQDRGTVLVEADTAASAIIAGVAALVRAAYPDLNAASVIQRLLTTAKDLGDPGRDGQYGFGIVDPTAAMTSTIPEMDANPLGDPGLPATASPGDDRISTIRSMSPIALAATLVVLLVVLAVAGVVVSRSRFWPQRRR